MPVLVSDHQTAFVQGRFRAENLLATRELLHHVHRSKSPALLLKLDFAKAFDTLDWSFLFNVMATAGFPQKFIKWVSNILSTSTSRLQINGSLSRPFSHKRDLRQGDPLSPYLFILAANVLQRMTIAMSIVIPHNLTDRIRQPVITLQYANDTMLLSLIRGNTLRKLMVLIHCFSVLSGLTVNFSKTMFVPLSIPYCFLPAIDQLLQCNRQNLPISYLGMPLSIKAPTREDFMPLLQKLERRLDGWKARYISRVGKLQLVKSVLSSIPTYFMSSFFFPKWLVARIDLIRRKFFWSKSQIVNPVHLLNWQSVCLPVRNGGLGVLNLCLQNISLLMRWWWRLYELDSRLWSTYATLIYSLKLNSTGPLLLSPVGSFFWKSLLKLKPIFHSSVFYQIYLGKQTSFWYDAWAGRPLVTDKQTPITRRAILAFDAKTCFHTLISGPLTLHQSLSYESITSLPMTTGTDKIIWRLSSSGQFTVKSLYKVLSQGGRTVSAVSPIWKAKVTPSMTLFFYLLIHYRLLTQDVM